MKKVLIILFLNTILCSSSFAESYYFNKCQLTNILYADYLIDLDKNIIKVKLEAADGTIQEFIKQKGDFLDAIHDSVAEWRKQNETDGMGKPISN